MNEHALDAMIYSWMVMKEKEESSMEGIYVGKVKRSVINKDNVNLLFVDHRQDIHHLSDVIDYEDTAYCLVPTNDIIINNDELLKLRDEVKELNEAKDKIVELEQKVRDERKWCDYWRHTYYAAEKVASVVGVSIKIDGIESQHNSAKVVVQNDKAEELKKQVVQMEDLEKKLKAAKSNETFWRDRKEEEEDYHHYWLHTFDRAVKQAAEKGIHIGVCGSDEEDNVGIVTIYNIKAEELETRVVALEKTNNNLDQKYGAADNALEYWNNTYNDIVIAGKKVGVKIDIKGKKPDSNAGFVYVTNEKAEDLEKQVVQMEDANQKLRQRISSADEEVDKVDKYWQRRYDDLAECWTNTHKDIVAVGKKVGVKIDIQGKKSDSNTCPVYITNEKALELMVNVSNTKHEYNKKWQAMLNALKDKGVEVIYMGEQDGKPCVDVKIPGWGSDKEWVTTFSKRVAELLADKFGLESERDELKEQCDILRKDGALKGQQCLKLKADLNALKKEYGRVISELAELKSETVAEVKYEFRPNCLTIIYTKCDGSKQTISMDSSEAIDANSISCGTVPKCESCKNHRYFTNGGHYCYLPDSEYKISGMFRCHSLTEEEVEGPACSDFKAKE